MSLLPAMAGDKLPARRIFVEHEGNRSVRDGNWKLVALAGKPWELYDIAADPTEMNDLAAKNPAEVAELSKAWQEWAERCKVVGPAKPRGQAAAVPSPQIANKALTITCDVTPRSKSGVIFAQGGRQHGYAVRLDDGKLAFDVRVGGKITTIVADQTPAGAMAIVARLKAGGAMELAINGKTVATGSAGGLIPVQPVDELTIGRDEQSEVGPYKSPHPLEGEITNVKVVAE